MEQLNRNSTQTISLNERHYIGEMYDGHAVENGDNVILSCFNGEESAPFESWEQGLEDNFKKLIQIYEQFDINQLTDETVKSYTTELMARITTSSIKDDQLIVATFIKGLKPGNQETYQYKGCTIGQRK